MADVLLKTSQDAFAHLCKGGSFFVNGQFVQPQHIVSFSRSGQTVTFKMSDGNTITGSASVQYDASNLLYDALVKARIEGYTDEQVLLFLDPVFDLDPATDATLSILNDSDTVTALTVDGYIFDDNSTVGNEVLYRTAAGSGLSHPHLEVQNTNSILWADAATSGVSVNQSFSVFCAFQGPEPVHMTNAKQVNPDSAANQALQIDHAEIRSDLFSTSPIGFTDTTDAAWNRVVVTVDAGAGTVTVYKNGVEDTVSTGQTIGSAVDFFPSFGNPFASSSAGKCARLAIYNGVMQKLQRDALMAQYA